MDESAPRPLTRSDLIDVSRSAGSGNAMMQRRIDSREPEIVPVWGSLVDFGARFFFLQDLAPGLPPTPPGNFDAEGKALDWLVGAINANLPEVCQKFRQAQSARLSVAADRAKEIAAHAQRTAEAADKRARESEVMGG